MGRSKMSPPQTRVSREGLVYGLAAYGCWGLVPLYFKAVISASPAELLAHRVVWTALLLAGILTLLRCWPDFAAVIRAPRTSVLLIFSSILIATNWITYIYGVATEQVTQASLGYFITPMVNVVLGVVFLNERLRPRQWLAVGMAAIGVLNLAITCGSLPWIALALAASFGLYGLMRKVLPVDGLTGLSVETFVLLPVAGGYLFYLSQYDTTAWSTGGWGMDVLLIASGVVTAVPLLCFGKAARLLPLTTLGFLQYLGPTLQLFLAVAVFGEPFTPVQLASFAFIWAGLVIFSAGSLAEMRGKATAQLMPCIDADAWAEQAATDG